MFLAVPFRSAAFFERSKIMKRISALLIAIIFLFSATPVFAESETATTGSGTVEDPWVVYNWSALKEKMALGGYITLGEDVLDTVKNDSSILTVPSGVTATLDLNGFEVNKNLTAKQKHGYVMRVEGTLNIIDSGENGKIIGGYTTTSSVSGIYTGGGLCVMGGTLNLYGGSICNNRCTDNGGGVFVNGNGAFNMYGGKIESNYSSYEGGGVAVYAGSFILEDGEISKNIANSFGGGVSVVKSGCTFVMNGGLLSENFSYYNGGGVGGLGTFTMNGGTITLNYTKNEHYGGGVYIGNDFKFYLNGGSITGNYVEYSNKYSTLELGGGVAVWGTGFYVKGSPIIKDNYCLNTATDVSTANDVDVQPAYGNWTVNLTGALEDGALIGVSAHGTGQVTNGFKTYHENDEPSEFFFADLQGYKPYKNANGEAAIKSVPKHTVSFNPNGGTGTMEPVEVYEGEEYTLPSNTFKKEGRSAYGWKVGNEYKSNVGDKITVTADTVVTAVYAQTKTVNLVKDNSTTDVEGTLTLKDTKTGESFDFTYCVMNYSSFSAPSNPAVEAAIAEAREGMLEYAKEKAGKHTVRVVKDELSDPHITDTVTTTTPKFVLPFDPSLTDEYPSIDQNGDLFVYTFLEGEQSHHWRYDVTIEAEFTSEAPKPDEPAPAPAPTPAPVLTPEEAAMPTEEKTEELVKKTNTDKKDIAGAEYQRLMLKATSKSKSITLKWKKVSGASGYIIYGAPCGKKMTRLATVTNPKTVKKTFKKLKKGTYYKYIVVAYKKTAAGNRIMSKSKSVHCATTGGKKGNPTGIKLKKTKITLKKGKKTKIKPTLLSKAKVATHIAKFRYESSNKKIATVDSKGNIKAKKKGTVTIYVYAQNGICKTIKVKVK